MLHVRLISEVATVEDRTQSVPFQTKCGSDAVPPPTPTGNPFPVTMAQIALASPTAAFTSSPLSFMPLHVVVLALALVVVHVRVAAFTIWDGVKRSTGNRPPGPGRP